LANRLVIFAVIPRRKFLPERTGCTFLSLYCPHFLYNVESLQFFIDDESICSFLQNEPLKRKDIISLEENKLPKGLTPLESSFSSSDVGNRKENKEDK